MSRFKQFTVAAAKRMPVIILADISGSMSVDGKIETLNRAIAEMIASFAQEEDVRAKIHVAVVTFGKGGAKIHLPLQVVSQTQWTDMEAVGSQTQAGSAFVARLLTVVTTLKSQKRSGFGVYDTSDCCCTCWSTISLFAP